MRFSRHISVQPIDLEDFQRDDECARREHRGLSQHQAFREDCRRLAGEEPEFESFVPRWWPTVVPRQS